MSARTSPKSADGSDTAPSTRPTTNASATTNGTASRSKSNRSGSKTDRSGSKTDRSGSKTDRGGSKTDRTKSTAKSDPTTGGTTSAGSESGSVSSISPSRIDSLLRKRLASGETSAKTRTDETETATTPQNGVQSEQEEKDLRERGLSSLMSEFSTKLSRRIKRDRDLDDNSVSYESTNVRSKTGTTSAASTGLSSRIRRRLASDKTDATTGATEDETTGETDAASGESETETDTGESETDTDTDEEKEGKSRTKTKESIDANHCTLCGNKLKEGKFKTCANSHRICFECFGFGDNESLDNQVLSINTCVACQRKVLDPEKNINGYPPRFLKFYLIRKLLEQDPGTCEVALNHAKNHIEAVFFCIDCDVHACRDCVLDHLDGGEKSSHNLLNLRVASYNSDKLYCFTCHVNEATSYCAKDGCDIPLCNDCARDKHKFHETFQLSQSQRSMLVYINKQRVIIREYRQAVDIELQRRKELREAKTEELDNLVLSIKDAAEELRKMVNEDEEKLLGIVTKHKDDILAVYKTLDEAVNRKDVILKYFEVIHDKIRAKKMDEDRRIDAFSFCRENEVLLKEHKELHARADLKMEAELATMKFTKRDQIEKFRLQGNNILGELNVKERKVDPDRLMDSEYTVSIEVRGRNDRRKPDITQIHYLQGTKKVAIVDSANCRVKVISKYDGILYSKDPDVRIDYIGAADMFREADRVLLAYNTRDELLIVCNASQDHMYVFTIDGKSVYHYKMPPGAGKALSLHHSENGPLYVGRSHISADKHGGIVEIHMMMQKGRYQLLRQQDRYYLDHRPRYITTTPSGYTIIYDGYTLVYLNKALRDLRTVDKRHKEWAGLEATDIFMTEKGNLVIVDPLNLYADNSITILNEDGYIVGFPLASSGEEGDSINGPQLITGDNGEHFYVVDKQSDRIKVLHNT